MAKGDLTFDVAANDKASATLDKVDKSVANTAKSTGEYADSAKRTARASREAGDEGGFFAKTLGDIDGASVAAGVGVHQLGGFLRQGIGDFMQMEQAATQYEFAMRQAGATTQDMNVSQAQMRQNFNDTAFSINAQQQALGVLARKTGDADLAQSSLIDAMDLASATGRDLSDVSKDLAEALTGDINALEELGILTEESTDELREMDDAGERAARAMEILRDKVAGASEEINPQVKTVKQLRTGYKEVRAAAGEWALTAGEVIAKMVTLNAETEKNATAMSDFAESIGESGEGLSALATYFEELDSGGMDEQTDSVKKLQAGFYEMIGAEEEAAELTRDRLGITKKQTAASRAMSEAQREHGRTSDEAVKAAQRYNDTLRETNELSRDQARINRGFAGFDFPEMPEPDTTFDPDPAPDPDDKKKEYASREEIERRKANIAYEAQRSLEDRKAELRDKMREREFEKAEDAREARLEADLKAIDEELQADLAAIDKRREKMDRFASYEEVGQAVSTGLSGVGRGASGVADLLEQATAANQVASDATEAERERAEEIRRSNERLARQISLYSDLSSTIGTVGEGIAELAEQEWDFAKAGEASLSALNAVSSAGKATAGILGKNTRQQAGIQAGFEAAAAAGATALALTNPAMAPQFYAAAAQHTAAAGMYTAVAAGAGSGTSASVGGAAAGGGGSAAGGGSNRTINVDDQREKTVNAFAEALQKEREPRQIINNNHFGAGSMLSDAPSVAREIDQVTRVSQEARMVRERN